MGTLWFIGLGLDDERGLGGRAIAALRDSAVVFAEEYTSSPPAGALDRVGEAIGLTIVRLDRAQLESETPVLQALERHDRVALLTGGDPFAATTHVALRVAAERHGHRWAYLPNASVLSAVPGFLGLMAYRFGRTVSLPLPEPRFSPRSPLEQLAENRARDLHSLLLLDLRPERGEYLTADRALALLRERDPDGAVVPEAAELAVAARVGREDARGWFGSFRELSGVPDFGAPMHTVVLLAPRLHFEEREALELFRLGRSDGAAAAPATGL